MRVESRHPNLALGLFGVNQALGLFGVNQACHCPAPSPSRSIE